MNAYLNHGRWVAHCDTPSCTGAESVWPDGQLRTAADGRKCGISHGVLHCANCGLTSQVVFPDNSHDIMRVLARRPVPETRNWYPGETVEELAVENTTFGVT